jgi:hypothetical protein
MGYWVIRNGKVVWEKGSVNTDELADTGQTQWWSSWAPSFFGIFNAQLPVYVKGSWTKGELAAVVKKIRLEIDAHQDKWTIEEKTLSEDGLSTCQAKPGHGKRHQSVREYNLVINRTNPLGYKPKGLTQEVLISIATSHEQTHALCDLSYTANNKSSRLATWNDDDGEYAEGSEASAQRKRMEQVWEISDADTYLSDEFRKLMGARFGYGYGNLIDIDTVVNELCLVASYLDIPLQSPTMRALIDLAELNLGFRAIGRKMQTEVAKLRVF